MKRAGLFLWLAFLAIIVQAQNITGQIFDSQTGDSIPFAALRYRGHKISMASNYAGFAIVVIRYPWLPIMPVDSP